MNINKTSKFNYFPIIYKLIPLFLIVISLPIILLASRQSQDTREHAAQLTTPDCTFTKWNGLPDWLPGSEALGNATITCIEGTTDFCKKTRWDVHGPLAKGTPVGHGGASTNFIYKYGALLPVSYDGLKDIIRFDAQDGKGNESSWAHVLRWTDETIKSQPGKSYDPTIILTYQLSRLKQEIATAGKDNSQTGFDLTDIDPHLYQADNNEKMLQEASSCNSTSPTTLSLMLLLDGIGNAGDYTNRTTSQKNNKKPQDTVRSLVLTILSPNATPASVPMTVTYNQTEGEFLGKVILPSSITTAQYTLSITMEGYLDVGIHNIPITRGSDNAVDQKIPLITGDLDKNNLLDNNDYTILLACIKKQNVCTIEQTKLSDLNDDGKTDQLDYNLFLRELPAKQGD